MICPWGRALAPDVPAVHPPAPVVNGRCTFCGWSPEHGRPTAYLYEHLVRR